MVKCLATRGNHTSRNLRKLRRRGCALRRLQGHAKHNGMCWPRHRLLHCWDQRLPLLLLLQSVLLPLPLRKCLRHMPHVLLMMLQPLCRRCFRRDMCVRWDRSVWRQTRWLVMLPPQQYLRVGR